MITTNRGSIPLHCFAKKCSDIFLNPYLYIIGFNKYFITKYYTSVRKRIKGFKQDRVYNYDDEQLFDLIHDQIRIDQINSNADIEEIYKWFKVNNVFYNVLPSDKKFHVIRLPTGVGKTANYIQWIIHIIHYTNNLKMDGIDTIVILAPDYDNAINEIEQQIFKFDKFNTDYKILEGKYRTCRYNNDVFINDGIEAGLSINSICKKDSGCRDNCEFYQTITTIESPSGIKFVITTQHQLIRYLPILLQKVNNMLLIIDENFENGIRTDFEIRLDVLLENIEFLKRVIAKKGRYKKITVEGHYVKEHTRKLRNGKTITVLGKWRNGYSYDRFIKSNPYYTADLEVLLDLLLLFNDIINEKIDYDKLQHKIKNILYLEETLELLNREGWYEYESKEVLPFKKFLFYQIKDFIDNYHFQKEEKPKNLDKWLKHSIIRITHTETKENYLSFKFYEQFKLINVINNDKIIQVINCDATASIRDIEILFNQKVVEHYIPNLYTNKIHIYQIKQENYGYGYPFALFYQQTIGSINSFRNIESDIKETIEIFPDINEILFISPEMKLRHFNRDLWNYLKEYVSPKLICEHFGLVSTNRYENYIVVITLGTPVIGSIDNERESGLLGRDPIERGMEKARNKIIQVIGRLFRGTHEIYAFIISGLDLKLDLPINFIYKYQEIINDRPIWRSAHKNWRKTMKELKKTRGKEVRVKVKENTNYDIILDFLKENNNEIESKDYMKLFDVSKPTALKYLQLLVKENKLKLKIVGQNNKFIYFL